MKRYAITLLIVPLLFAGVLLVGSNKEDHVSSPAFTVELNRAIDQLEGAAVKVTAAVTPRVEAGALNYTTDPITCDASPECQELTSAAKPCFTLQDEQPTCDQASVTCDVSPTCYGRYTCDDRTTCSGTETCDAAYTCWNSTCEVAGQTCDGETPTCDAGAGCDFTVDGTQTCNGTATCYNTCEGWPDCAAATYDGSPTCDGNETCQNTCCGFPGCDELTCNSGFTCDGSETCDGVSNTCTETCSTYPTCQANPDCGITYDNTVTCDGSDTCTSTCNGWPTCDGEVTCAGSGLYTCDPEDPRCCNATEHTSWGKLKMQFK